MIGIYKIISPSGKVYIGQSIDIESRWYGHEKSLNNVKGTKIIKSFREHGFENHTFEILEECEIEKLNERERHFQDFYDVLGPNGLNLTLTGTNDLSGTISEETRSKMSSSQKGLNKTLSEEHKKKLLEINLGKVHSEEHRKNNTEGQKRFWNSERRLERSKNNSNRKLTEEQVLEIRSSTLSQTELVKIYGINQGSISNIIHRRSWKHL